jgi:DNA segregation ATPase FtsK/SpoIIIE, S-DNA-T family
VCPAAEAGAGTPAYAGLTAEGLTEALADEGVAVRKKDGVLTVRARLVQAALADRDE